MPLIYIGIVSCYISWRYLISRECDSYWFIESYWFNSSIQLDLTETFFLFLADWLNFVHFSPLVAPCGLWILVPRPEIKPRFGLKCRIQTPEPPGSSLNQFYYSHPNCYNCVLFVFSASSLSHLLSILQTTFLKKQWNIL